MNKQRRRKHTPSLHKSDEEDDCIRVKLEKKKKK